MVPFAIRTPGIMDDCRARIVDSLPAFIVNHGIGSSGTKCVS
jgi:hypothetical protein